MLTYSGVGEALGSVVKESAGITFEIIRGESSCPFPNSPPLFSSSDMIYYSVDPNNASSLVFSLCSRHERFGGSSLLPDGFSSFSCSSVPSAALAYAQTVGFQLIALGDHYANTLAKVRVGTVIFLVGIGSMVCWKVWDHWTTVGDLAILGGRSGTGGGPKEHSGAGGPPPPTTNSSKNVLSSCQVEEEFVDDFDFDEEEDPMVIEGKYFGPESPVERRKRGRRLEGVSSKTNNGRTLRHQPGNKSPPETDDAVTKSPPPKEENVLQDLRYCRRRHSEDNADAGSLTSSDESEDENSRAFYDRLLDCSFRVRRLKKRRYKTSREHSRTGLGIVHEKPKDDVKYGNSNSSLSSPRFHPYERQYPPQPAYDFSSSETSPRFTFLRSESSKNLWRDQLNNFRLQMRSQGDGSETPDWDKCGTATRPSVQSFLDDKQINLNAASSGNRLQPDGEECETSTDHQRSRSSEVSVSEKMEQARQKGAKRPLHSRDDSTSSLSSNFLLRVDSICSNISELAASDCSELSVELSAMNDRFAEQTIISFADIEQELDHLKSSMHEMDCEYERYASRPNPYLLKTTFTDLSMDSEESPMSPNDLDCRGEPRESQFTLPRCYPFTSEDVIPRSKDSEEFSSLPIETPRWRRRSGVKFTSSARNSRNTSLDSSLSENAWKNAFFGRRGSSTENSIKFSQDEPMPSLEWDNSECLKQYEDDGKTVLNRSFNELECIQESNLPGFVTAFKRLKFLPDHASLELDLETELQSANECFNNIPQTRETFAPSLNPAITPFINPSSFSPFDYHTTSSERNNNKTNQPFFSPVAGKTQKHHFSSRFPSSNSSLAQDLEISGLEMKHGVHKLGITKREIPPSAHQVGGINLEPGIKPLFRRALPPSTLNLNCAASSDGFAMCASLDSAVHSGPASRSGSSTPRQQQLFNHSMMSSGFISCLSESSSLQDFTSKRKFSSQGKVKFVEDDETNSAEVPSTSFDGKEPRDLPQPEKQSFASTQKASSDAPKLTNASTENSSLMPEGRSEILPEVPTGAEIPPETFIETQTLPTSSSEAQTGSDQQVTSLPTTSSASLTHSDFIENIVAFDKPEEINDNPGNGLDNQRVDNIIDATPHNSDSQPSSLNHDKDMNSSESLEEKFESLEKPLDTSQLKLEYGEEETVNVQNAVQNSLAEKGQIDQELNGEVEAEVHSQEVDSVECDDFESVSPTTVLAVQEAQDVVAYSKAEWQGKTNKAKTIRKGYRAISDEMNLKKLYRIRGDNYCGIRAALFSVLLQGIAIPSGQQTIDRLLLEIDSQVEWLHEYSFGHRLDSHLKGRSVIDGFKECLEVLDRTVNTLNDSTDKTQTAMSLLNSNPLVDIQLCEAVKLLMLVNSLDLKAALKEGRPLPLFGQIMFARDTSRSPREFLLNHLNDVGDSSGLEQVEMFLLGHSLRVTLRVARPSNFGREDFVTFYPDDHLNDWPQVTLVAEDDRHYNALSVS